MPLPLNLLGFLLVQVVDLDLELVVVVVVVVELGCKIQMQEQEEDHAAIARSKIKRGKKRGSNYVLMIDIDRKGDR